MKRKEQRTKTKLARLLLLLAVAFGLLSPGKVGATGACTAPDFHFWQDMGCNQNNGGDGGIPKAKCPSCPPCCGNGSGMPRWWVSEPYEDLWIADTPLSYTLSSGKEMSFTFTYRQDFQLPASDEYLAGPKSPVFYADLFSTYARTVGLTNAAWGNNWMMDIVFWDAHWETDWQNLSGQAPNYPVFSTEYETFVFQPQGGINYFYKQYSGGTSLRDPHSQMRLQPLSALGYPTANIQPPDTNGIYWGDPQTNGFCLVYPDGGKDIFGFCYYTMGWTPGNSHPFTQAHAFLTQRIDPQGRITRIGYEKCTNNLAYRVRYVVDPDGRTNTFLYNIDLSGSIISKFWQVAEIDDPYGRKATFGYSTSGALANMIDAAGMSNSVGYQYVDSTNFWVSSLTTPYGNTIFSYANISDPTVTNGFSQRAISVSEPEGAHQLFLYLHNNSYETNTDTAPTVPGQSFDDGNSGANHPGLNYRNTYHWNRQQAATLTQNWPQSAADYKKAHLKHWLWQTDNISISESLSSERDPSLDAAGQIPGLRTWYNYSGKSGGEPEVAGSSPQVGCIARLLPEGTNQYTTYNYYPSGYPAAGLVSDNESTYSLPNGTIGVLTTSFGYAGNGVDLTSVQNSAGQSWNLGYNANHQITSIANALNQVTRLSWDSYTFNLTGVQWPSGLSATLSYNTDGYMTNYPVRHWVPGPSDGLLQTISWSPSGRSFTITAYTNGLPYGLPYSVTDDRGVTVANTWDGLNRLTSTRFPDGTSVSNVYNRLDLAAAKDRLGNWTYYVYDGLQHLTTITNANNAVTLLSWCGCGSLNQIFDAVNGLAHPTTLNYDNQGNLTNITYPDLTSLTYQYDLAGRMINAFDGAGRSVQLGYNNQGLATTVSSASGILQQVIYDALNRPISITDANGITVTNTYDAINELLKRTWSDGVSEGFGYSTNGLIAYTNRDQQPTFFTRDGAGRLLAITNANHEVTQFGYDSLNNITNLVDGLLHTTTWQYNEYGWLTNKVDALNRNIAHYNYNADGWVTSRSTPEKGNTGYTYDNVGNLKSVNYPLSTINYSYDALNRLTNMVDGFGTTAFGYTPAGQLQSENGPWANDTVSYVYRQMLRTNLTLTQPSGSWVQGYGYDSVWRMTSVVSPAGTFGYQYVGSGPSTLVSRLTLPNGASITNGYDSLARLAQTALNNSSGQTLDAYSYLYDPLGLRTNVTRNLGAAISTATAGYDAIGQLTGWTAQEANGMARLNEQLGFGYDAAHNLHTRANNALSETFAVDAANELTSVTRNGTLTVGGNTLAPATSVTVNGQAAQTYGDSTFANTNNSLINGNNPFTTIAQNAGGASVTNNITVNLPQSATLLYDNNGNLTNSGGASSASPTIYAYDNENQLTNVMVPGQWRATYVYDGLGRRRIARDYTWKSGNWVPTNEVHYVYDGMLPVQERDINNNPLVTYTRGIDLGGDLWTAGGIGGLLARTDGNGSTFYHADGSGNITALMNGSQNIVARYLYNPYGKLVGEWGGMAEANKYRFSSKEWDPLSGMYYYGFRFYDPILQRWPNRDPIGERGGINLYGHVGNDPVNWIDPDGNQMVMTFPTWVWPKSPNPVNLAFTAGALLGTGLYMAFPNAMTKPGEWCGNMMSQRPARNRNRDGHTGGNDSDTHGNAQGHSGKEKPNFTRAPQRPSNPTPSTPPPKNPMEPPRVP